MSDENGKLNWSIIGALVALGALGHQAISTVDENRKNGDADLRSGIEGNRGRIEVLETARVADAYNRGQVEEKLAHLEQRAEVNSGRIDSSFRELDDKLQRENNLGKEALKASLDELDHRFQNELGTLQTGKQSELLEIRGRINALDEWRSETIKNRWTKDDQHYFEDQLGLILKAEKKLEAKQ